MAAAELIEALDPNEVVNLMSHPAAQVAFAKPSDAAPAAPVALDEILDALKAWCGAKERAADAAAADVERVARELAGVQAKLAEAERRLQAYDDLKRELRNLVRD